MSTYCQFTQHATKTIKSLKIKNKKGNQADGVQRKKKAPTKKNRPISRFSYFIVENED